MIAPKKRACQTGNPIQITQSRGILASLVAAETGCGSAHAPWHLRALPGQRINITLLDFSWAAATNDVFFLPASGRKSSPETGPREVKNCIRLYAYNCHNVSYFRDRISVISATDLVCLAFDDTTVFVSVDIQGVSKKVPPLNLFGIFSLRLSLFAWNFANLLAVHIHTYLPIFVHLSYISSNGVNFSTSTHRFHLVKFWVGLFTQKMKMQLFGNDVIFSSSRVR